MKPKYGFGLSHRSLGWCVCSASVVFFVVVVLSRHGMESTGGGIQLPRDSGVGSERSDAQRAPEAATTGVAQDGESVAATNRPVGSARRSLPVGGPDAIAATEGDRQPDEAAIWEEFYRDATYFELQGELLAILDAISATTTEAIPRKFEEGAYEVLIYGNGEPNQESIAEYLDNSVLAGFEFTGNGDVRRVVLSEDEFPAEYTLLRQANWIEGAMARRPREFRGQDKDD